MTAMQAAKGRSDKRTAWRIEGTLREFERFPPRNLWFDYPVHQMDGAGCLQDIRVEGEAPYAAGSRSNQKKSGERKKTRLEKLEEAISMCDTDGKPTTRKVAEYMDVDPSSVSRYIKDYGDMFCIDKNDGVIKRVQEAKP